MTTCARSGCDNPVAVREGRGRPAIYCSPGCRTSSHRRAALTVEVEHPQTCSDGRPVERVWTVRLRRGQRVVVIAEALGWPSANALAGQLHDILAGPTEQRGGGIE